MKIVSLDHVWVYLDDTKVLEDVTLSIEDRDFLAIIGPNGGGKTTLLKVILGLIKPSSGRVKVFGKKPEEGRKLIGYLPQFTHFDLDFPVSVFDVVLMGRYRGMFKNYSIDDREAAAKALKAMGMLKFKDRQINKLSSGQLQRVFIARAIAREPKLLLLDEPTASIDPEMQRFFYELLLKLRQRMAIVLVTHDIGAISTYVDKVACLNRKLFYHGSKELGLEKLEEVYQCPIELVAHGVRRRVLRRHER